MIDIKKTKQITGKCEIFITNSNVFLKAGV
jgi:hypothetical protein